MGKIRVSVIMGSQSDWQTMKVSCEMLDEIGITYEKRIVSAHRTPDRLFNYAAKVHQSGIKVIIAGAGGAAHLPGVVAAFTHLPIIGVPCRSSISIDGWDSILSILQMPPGVPVATVGLDGAHNAGILAAQILAVGDNELSDRVLNFKQGLKQKIIKANESLSEYKFKFRTN